MTQRPWYINTAMGVCVSSFFYTVRIPNLGEEAMAHRHDRMMVAVTSER